MTNCVVQVDGVCLRAPAAVCRRMVMNSAETAAAAWRMAELQMSESRQSTLCQALHSVEQRLSRWLLETEERCGGRNPLPMTQEFLAAMLGVQRTTVTAFAGRAQAAGQISYRRGKIEIVDRAAVENRACECLDVMREERTRLGLSAVRTETVRA